MPEMGWGGAAALSENFSQRHQEAAEMGAFGRGVLQGLSTGFEHSRIKMGSPKVTQDAASGQSLSV